MADDEETTYRAIRDALSEALTSRGGMLLRYTLVWEAMDSDGVREIGLTAHDEATPWDLLGLLNYARIRAERMALALGDDEDEDA